MDSNDMNTRYNVNWDCSNQNKRYTQQEKIFIQQSWENDISTVEIAKSLKRGLWATEVQIMYIQNNSNDTTNVVVPQYVSTQSLKLIEMKQKCHELRKKCAENEDELQILNVKLHESVFRKVKIRQLGIENSTRRFSYWS
eukprot:255697_1